MDSISHVKGIHLSVHITYNIDQVLKMFVFTGLVSIINKHCTYIHIYVQSEAQNRCGHSWLYVMSLT